MEHGQGASNDVVGPKVHQRGAAECRGQLAIVAVGGKLRDSGRPASVEVRSNIVPSTWGSEHQPVRWIIADFDKEVDDAIDRWRARRHNPYHGEVGHLTLQLE